MHRGVRLGERVSPAHNVVGAKHGPGEDESGIREPCPTEDRPSPPLLHLAFNQFIRQAAEILHDQILAYLVDIDFDAQLIFQV
jgi:hypothetical protein